MTFWKTHSRQTLLRAYEKGTVKDLCEAILCRAMDENNTVKTEKVLAAVLADLTGKDQRRIQEALQSLVEECFGTWDRHTFTVDPEHASKARQRPKYSGPRKQYSEAALEFYARLQFVFPKPEYKKKDEEMIAQLKKQVEEQTQRLITLQKQGEDTLALLRELLAGQNPIEVKEKAARHLVAIDGGRRD